MAVLLYTPSSDIRNEDGLTLPNRKSEDPLPSLDIVKALLDRGVNLMPRSTAPLPGAAGWIPVIRVWTPERLR